jgi:hypothetical protein
VNHRHREPFRKETTVETRLDDGLVALRHGGAGRPERTAAVSTKPS